MTAPTILTFFIGGTYSASHEEAWELFDLDKNYKDGNFGQRETFEWPGGNDHSERVIGAFNLRVALSKILRMDFVEVLNIVGFSHGGTVAMLALDQLLSHDPLYDDVRRLDQYRLFTIAAPALTRYSYNALSLSDWSNVDWVNIYSERDSVQGSGLFSGIRIKDDLMNGGRFYNDSHGPLSRDIRVDDPKKGHLSIHRSLPRNPDVIRIIERAVVNG